MELNTLGILDMWATISLLQFRKINSSVFADNYRYGKRDKPSVNRSMQQELVSHGLDLGGQI